MRFILNDLAQLINDITNPSTIMAIIAISGVFWRMFKYFSKKMDEHYAKLEVMLLRTELLQAIEHDYGIENVSQVYDLYHKAGGNSYGTTRYEQYLKEKEEKSEDLK